MEPFLQCKYERTSFFPHAELKTLQVGESGHPRDDGQALEEPAARPDER